MGVPFQACEEALDKAVDDLFDCDPQIQAVGIARHGEAFGFKAVKNAAKVVATALGKKARRPPRAIKKIPVTIQTVTAAVEPHARVPYPAALSLVPERQPHRPLACGLQVQNVDDDDRQRHAGQLARGFILVGTLGCFVRLPAGPTAILSNNHVLAGENRGRKGKDRILQPGSPRFTAREHVATLSDFVPLHPSPPNARPARGNVLYNDVDAAVAQLKAGVPFLPGYLPARNLPVPSGLVAAHVGDRVFKVGRTTGLTHGTITAVGTVVGPIDYAPGPCWFRRQVEVVGEDGTLFSDHGDSGSAVLSTTGQVVGLVFAGNGTQSYASPIETVLTALGCTLA
jgi:S1-C subfamily serine protease